jgi:hypothetical protein
MFSIARQGASVTNGIPSEIVNEWFKRYNEQTKGSDLFEFIRTCGRNRNKVKKFLNKSKKPT